MNHIIQVEFYNGFMVTLDDAGKVYRKQVSVSGAQWEVVELPEEYNIVQE